MSTAVIKALVVLQHKLHKRVDLVELRNDCRVGKTQFDEISPRVRRPKNQRHIIFAKRRHTRSKFLRAAVKRRGELLILSQHGQSVIASPDIEGFRTVRILVLDKTKSVAGVR